MFLRIVTLLGLNRHKGGTVEALVTRLLGQRLVGHAGLCDGLRDGDRAGHHAGNQQDHHDEAADPFLLCLLKNKKTMLLLVLMVWEGGDIEVQLTILIFELLDLAMKSFHLELKGNYYEQYFSKRYLFQPN